MASWLAGKNKKSNTNEENQMRKKPKNEQLYKIELY